VTLRPDTFPPPGPNPPRLSKQVQERPAGDRVGVEERQPQGRSRIAKTRLKWWQIGLVFGLGVLTAVIQSALLHTVGRFDIGQQLRQTAIPVVQSLQSTGWLPPSIEVPTATAGFSQIPLQSYGANFAYLGHLPYDKPAADRLVPFPETPPYMTQAGEYLHQEAVLALKRMMESAQTEGIFLFLVSGFRDLTTQNLLFQARAAEAGSVETAAKAVAPPGYSEHHTGYAIDLADGLGDFRKFDQTPAFRWMTSHAHEFGFELSFPDGNPQGIDYEPWHWRFVGSTAAADVFATAQAK
jgi:zinc D-Ala-D-Ala carboxypeptidase